MKALSTALILASGTALHAQVNWTVGVPVAFKWSDLTVYASGCTPNADTKINFSAAFVSGVGYYAIVDAVTPPGSNTIMPYGLAPLNVGDTVQIASAAPNYVYFPTGTGSMTLSLWAFGTPTTAGQVHPCVFNNLWMSDLLICPEGLSTVVSNTCTVQAGNTGVAILPASTDAIELPGPDNAWTLRVTDPAVTKLELINACGSVVASASKGSIGVGALPDGLYFVRVTGLDDARTERVVLAR